MTEESAHRVAGAGSGRKLLQTLLCFTEAHPTWTVADLAAELGLATTSTYRYVALLREVGLLDRASGKSYRVTDLALNLGRACEAARAPLTEAALPVITRVRDEIDETVLIARSGGEAAYCVERAESRRPVRLQFDKGQPMPLHAGSMSRILLASMSRAERASILAGILPGLSPARAALLSDEELDRTHLRGWTESFEEVDEGIWGTAAAITSHGAVVASIGTAAPMFRTDQTRRDRMIELIRAAASEISLTLSAD
ncbi:IclR family transcriptional regulator [Streptosporangium sp. NPDC006013]|uniref:IclR family transcriptional regulator n=1 Tax=Streptosporangium sp. NPDC006013 TaxID=3155596 RepID=UPI0033AC43FD